MCSKADSVQPAESTARNDENCTDNDDDASDDDDDDDDDDVGADGG